MALSAALTGHRNKIIEKWIAGVLRTYPESTTKFLSQKQDPFRNPVGHALQENLAALFDGLLQLADIQSLLPFLDGIVRIRAVQDFTAGQAVAFSFQLKKIIREEFSADLLRYSKEIAALEGRIDELALLAFDLFTKCREQMYESKVNEIKRRAFILERIQEKERSRS
jgi:hypothetical protein